MRTFITAAAAVLAIAGASSVADGHQSSCHRQKTCPSDHGTYRWHGLKCVSIASGESRAGYPKKVRYGGRTYYCKG